MANARLENLLRVGQVGGIEDLEGFPEQSPDTSRVVSPCDAGGGLEGIRHQGRRWEGCGRMVVHRVLQHRLSRFWRCQMRAGIMLTMGERRKGRGRAEVREAIDAFLREDSVFQRKIAQSDFTESVECLAEG